MAQIKKGSNIGPEKENIDLEQVTEIKVEAVPSSSFERAEAGLESEEKVTKEKKDEKVKAPVAPAPPQPAPEPELDYQARQKKEIDKILAFGLDQIFLEMSPKEQQRFRLAGEETVTKINELLSKTQVKVKQIVELIKKWLKLIPGVNKYFLEKEAKIKADKIINLKKRL